MTHGNMPRDSLFGNVNHLKLVGRLKHLEKEHALFSIHFLKIID